jgi:exodeoxyribonuclease III
MTYNLLRGGKDGDSTARLAQACTLIRQVAPDVLVLNECSDFERDGFRTFHRLEHELGLRGLFAPASSGYHVALYLRGAAPLEIRPLEVRLLERELHHTAIAARLTAGSRQFTVVATHLCPFSGEARVTEAQQLSRFFTEEPLFLLGDLNSLSPHDAAQLTTESWLPRRRVRHQLPGGGLDTRAISVIEACGLVDVLRATGGAAPTALTRSCTGWQDYQVRIDYVFASPTAASAVVRAERVDGVLADAASDHYPLYVDLEL